MSTANANTIITSQIITCKENITSILDHVVLKLPKDYHCDASTELVEEIHRLIIAEVLLAFAQTFNITKQP